jgi:CheY-like chemotaxis protein
MLPGRVHPILLLEDEPDDASFVRRVLRKHGIVNELIVCRTVEEAKQAMDGGAALRPALAIVDLLLPNGENGLQFLDWVRRQGPAVAPLPAMVYSASRDDAHRTAASALRSVVFLPKPATEESLAAAVQALGFVLTTTVAGGQVKRVIEPR